MTTPDTPPATAAEPTGSSRTGEQPDTGETSATPRRLDVELVRRGLARSRTHAAKLVAAGRVEVAGRAARRPAVPVGDAARIEVLDGDDAEAGGGAGEVDWVSRGAVKLDRALTALASTRPPGVPVEGRRCLDAGASTGGFTEVLLRRGAGEVLAVDVGHDQLAPGLRSDPRVRDLEGVSVRGLDPATLGGPADLLVADLSFISLRTVLPDLVGLVHGQADLVLMVKPQFEVGRARLPRGGVVREVGDRADAVVGVAATARDLGWAPVAAVGSELPGPAGNVEFFVWFSRTGDDVGDAALVRTVEQHP